MKAYHVKLFRHGKKLMTRKLRPWALPDTLKKTASVLLYVLLFFLSVLCTFEEVFSSSVITIPAFVLGLFETHCN